MTDITHEEARDLIPDLLNGGLDPVRSAALEAHLAGCAECREELEALRLVKMTPSFEPLIDAAKIVAIIPPYGQPLPAAPITRRPRFQFLLAAAAVLVVGALVLSRVPGAITKPA